MRLSYSAWVMLTAMADGKVGAGLERHEAGLRRPSACFGTSSCNNFIKLAYLNQAQVLTSFVEVLRCGLACATDF
jgi:hypothetical protein